MNKTGVILVCAALVVALCGAAAASLSWSRIDGADLPLPRHLTASAVLDGKLYVIGGATGGQYGEDTQYADVDVFDPATRAWTKAAPLQTPRMKAGACVIDGKIYVYGGQNSTSGLLDSLEIYDPAANSWSYGPAGLRAVAFNAVVAAQGELWSIGGEAGGIWPPWTSMVQIYSPATNQWRLGLELPWGDGNYGAQLAAVTYMDGDKEWVHFAGGVGWFAQVDTSARINAVVGGESSTAWEGVSPLRPDVLLGSTSDQHGVSSHSAVSYRNTMFVIGGDFGPWGKYDSVEYLVPGTGWVLDSHLPVALSGRPAAGVIGSDIYVTAGRTEGDVMNAAVYVGSWQVDTNKIWWARSVRDGLVVNIMDPKVITRTYLNASSYKLYFWIEESDRTCAIKVGPVDPISVLVSPGNKVLVHGIMGKDPETGERMITPDIDPVVDPGFYDIPARMGITNRSFIGAARYDQPGRTGAYGLNNMGMLVTISGKVTTDTIGTGYDGNSYFYIDDGGGLIDGTDTGGIPNVGIRVYNNAVAPAKGKVVSATGIVSSEIVNGQMIPVLLTEVSSSGDVVVYN